MIRTITIKTMMEMLINTLKKIPMVRKRKTNSRIMYHRLSLKWMRNANGNSGTSQEMETTMKMRKGGNSKTINNFCRISMSLLPKKWKSKKKSVKTLIVTLS